MKIGFFDSGLGGLTILKAVARGLPQYDYEYYGDTANVPYGDKTEEEIFEYTKQGIEHFVSCSSFLFGVKKLTYLNVFFLLIIWA